MPPSPYYPAPHPPLFIQPPPLAAYRVTVCNLQYKKGDPAKNVQGQRKIFIEYEIVLVNNTFFIN
jgi:hypothetical protein